MDMAMAGKDEDFFSHCPPTRCGKHGPEIRFPFHLDSSNKSSVCGAPCMNLACSGEDTILLDSAFAAYKVTAIDYRSGALTITPPVNYSSCHLINRLKSACVDLYPLTSSWDRPPHLCYPVDYTFAAVVRCSRKFTPKSYGLNDIAVPIPCLSNATHFSYFVDAYADIFFLPLDCKLASEGMMPIPTPIFDNSIDYSARFKELAERIINVSDMTVYFSDNHEIVCNCTHCERRGRRCAFSSQMNQTFCMHHGMVSTISITILLRISICSFKSSKNFVVRLSIKPIQQIIWVTNQI
jgi:hypothetical protein